MARRLGLPFDVFVIAPSSQKLEPPKNPARFTGEVREQMILRGSFGREQFDLATGAPCARRHEPAPLSALLLPD